jgi:lactoylglutathione lyase
VPTSRERLHRLIDTIPEESLAGAEKALEGWYLRSDESGGDPRIHHVAAWVSDLQRARMFYERWFLARCEPLYSSSSRKFESYFMAFSQGAKLELMASPDEEPRPAHVALSVGSIEAVDDLFERMRSEGVPTVGRPRRTSDGYYEAVILDSEGNLVEMTV